MMGAKGAEGRREGGRKEIDLFLFSLTLSHSHKRQHMGDDDRVVDAEFITVNPKP